MCIILGLTMNLVFNNCAFLKYILKRKTLINYSVNVTCCSLSENHQIALVNFSFNYKGT